MNPTSPTEAVVLQRDRDDLLLMLDRPTGSPPGGLAVLICPPFGWAHDCAYRGLRTWARTLCAAGHSVARLQLPATGDSAGHPRDADLLAEWRMAVGAAAGWLRETHSTVAVLGLGLGGLLACLAVSDGAPVDALLLWSVPARGRALMREMRSLHQMVATRFDEPGEEPAGGGGAGAGADPAQDADELIELTGYAMSADTVAALEGVDLSQCAFPDRGRALLLDRDGLPFDRRLSGALQAAGWQIDQADGVGFADLMANPQQSRAPEATIALTREWLASLRPPGRPPASPPASGAIAATGAPGEATAQPAAQPPVTASAVAVGALGLDADGIAATETPLWLPGRHGRLFGVLTQPAPEHRRDLCVVLLGAGALPHTGPNRSWVDFARRWASAGISTLRVDLSGVGESDGDPDELREDDSFYAPWRDTEVAGILDALSQRGVGGRFVLGGLCSGAYCGLQRAVVDDRVVGLLLINLYAFRYSRALVEERGRRTAIGRGLPNARGRRIDREFVAKALNYIRPDRAWRLARGSVERRQRRETVRILDVLARRGVQSLLLLGIDEPLARAMAAQGLSDGPARWPGFTVRRIGSRDHMYRALPLQAEVAAELTDALGHILSGGAADRPDAEPISVRSIA